MAPRPPGGTLPGNSEEALRARGDLLLLLVRGALTPEDIAEAFIPPQHLLRTIRRDAVMDDAARRRLKQWCFQQGREIPELPAMSERRARVYSALYEDLNMTHLLRRPFHVTHETVEERRVLEYFQKLASNPKRDSTALVHKALEPWITGLDENLTGRQFQEARHALGLYLFELHDSLLEDIKGLPPNDTRFSMQDKTRIPVFEKAMKDVHAKRIATQSPKERQIGAAHQIIAAAFVVRRSREAAQRLAEALELYYATRSSIRNLLHHRYASSKDRRRTPLSDSEQKIIRYVYREPLDAPLPSLRKNRAPIRAFIGRRNA